MSKASGGDFVGGPTAKIKRPTKIVLIFVVGLLFVVLPIVSEQKALAPIIWFLDGERDDVSSANLSHLVMGISNRTSSPALQAKPEQDDVGSGSKATRDAIPNQIDRYFDELPHNVSDTQWIRDYFHWHRGVREEFVDVQLFEDPRGPNMTILYLDPRDQGGGLTDRMKSLGHVLKRAHEQRRLLLFKWYDSPLNLESFLVPSLLNFTVPSHPSTETPELLRAAYEELGQGRIILCKFVNQLGNYHYPYGVIWNALFKPSAQVQAAIDHTKSALGLVSGKYDAVHCRIGHPAFRGKSKYDNEMDRKRDQEGGFKFEGVNRVSTMKVALHGIQCVRWAAEAHNFTQQLNRSTIYFYADSADLVKAVVAPESWNARGDEQLSLVQELKNVGSENKVVGRKNAAITHIQNRNKETPISAFRSTFVDLYIAAGARCIAMGVGRFAYMAAKISGTACWTRHQTPPSSVAGQWGMTLMSREVPTCPIGTS